MGGSRGETGCPDPPPPAAPQNNHKNIGFHSNTGPDPLKTTRLPSQDSMLGHHLQSSETPFKWRFAGGQMVARLWWYLDPLSFHQLKKKNVFKVGSPLTKLSGYVHAMGRSVVCDYGIPGHSNLFSKIFIVSQIFYFILSNSCTDPEGDGGLDPSPPLKITKYRVS